jgi:4,5-dihydroxyphthalate decarboxylase
MSKIELTLAVGPYEHVRDLTSGKVTIEGVDLNVLNLPTLEIFHRMTEHAEFDIGEMSFGRYTGLLSRGDDRLVALPVFVSRVFRHSAIYIRSDGAVSRPEDLAGKRIGVPEWAQTAVIYMRGWLQHEVGARLEDITWVVGGVNAPNPVGERVATDLPPSLRVRYVSDRSLSQMLLDGDIDAMFSAGPPHAFTDGNPRMRRLFTDFTAVEEEYYRRTRIFPIMHILCMRRELTVRHPWLAMNVLRAFQRAKERSLDDLRFSGSMSRYALPLANAFVARARQVFGEDFWPYGLEANRPTLEAFVRYGFEQGVCKRLLSIEELFPDNARDLSTFYTAHEPGA